MYFYIFFYLYIFLKNYKHITKRILSNGVTEPKTNSKSRRKQCYRIAYGPASVAPWIMKSFGPKLAVSQWAQRDREPIQPKKNHKFWINLSPIPFFCRKFEIIFFMPIAQFQKQKYNPNPKKLKIKKISLPPQDSSKVVNK